MTVFENNASRPLPALEKQNLTDVSKQAAINSSFPKTVFMIFAILYI